MAKKKGPAKTLKVKPKAPVVPFEPDVVASVEALADPTPRVPWADIKERLVEPILVTWRKQNGGGQWHRTGCGQFPSSDYAERTVAPTTNRCPLCLGSV